MPLLFEWDQRKADANLQKHGVSFEEASTVFGDPLSVTISDPAHSTNEDCFVIMGASHERRRLVLVHSDREGKAMKKRRKPIRVAEMEEEYDFSGGVRGKYAERYRQGSNVVLLDPDVAKVFPDSESVNRSLRDLARIIRRRERRSSARKSGRRSVPASMARPA